MPKLKPDLCDFYLLHSTLCTNLGHLLKPCPFRSPGVMLLGGFAAQALILVLTMAIFFALFQLPRAGLAAMRRRGRTSALARRHFILGAQHLARARAVPPGSSPSIAYARSTLEEADRAAAADPRDAAVHILRAAALEILGRRAPAVRALDTALSAPATRSLAPSERADALIKRAELHLAGAPGKGRRRIRALDLAIEDLLKAATDNPASGRAFCFLGECYEDKGMPEEARKAYLSALATDESNYSVKVTEALRRMEMESGTQAACST